MELSTIISNNCVFDLVRGCNDRDNCTRNHLTKSKFKSEIVGFINSPSTIPGMKINIEAFKKAIVSVAGAKTTLRHKLTICKNHITQQICYNCRHKESVTLYVTYFDYTIPVTVCHQTISRCKTQCIWGMHIDLIYHNSNSSWEFDEVQFEHEPVKEVSTPTKPKFAPAKQVSAPVKPEVEKVFVPKASAKGSYADRIKSSTQTQRVFKEQEVRKVSKPIVTRVNKLKPQPKPKSVPQPIPTEKVVKTTVEKVETIEDKTEFPALPVRGVPTRRRENKLAGIGLPIGIPPRPFTANDLIDSYHEIQSRKIAYLTEKVDFLEEDNKNFVQRSVDLSDELKIIKLTPKKDYRCDVCQEPIMKRRCKKCFIEESPQLMSLLYR